MLVNKRVRAILWAGMIVASRHRRKQSLGRILVALADIDHIVFVMLENRSFDHMLGYLSLDGSRADIDGLRPDEGWKASHANYDSSGTEYRSEPLPADEKVQDPPHGPDWVELQIDTPPAVTKGPRKMGGFVHTYLQSRVQKGKKRPKNPKVPMGYYDGDDVWAFDFLAKHYCVCQRWFTPLPAGTQPNRLMAMGGEAHYVKNKIIIPRHDLVYDWCRRNDIEWGVYVWGAVLPFFALMPNWWDDVAKSQVSRQRFRPFGQLEADWKGSAPVPQVLFIEPEYTELRGKHANDDHAPTRITGGQSFIHDIYNILISNKERWRRTLLIITYDEHGGFYDHVPPLPVKGAAGKRAFETTGPRVPAFLVSQHVDVAQVFNGEVDHTSFLALLAERHTSRTPYSDAVDARQRSYSGFKPLSSALRDSARTEDPPPMPSPFSVKAMKMAIPFGFGPADSSPHADTPAALGFYKAAQRTVEKHPEMQAHLPELTGYVKRTTPPVVNQDSHIGDE